MKLNVPVSFEPIKAQLLNLPEAPARLRHLALATALGVSLGVGYVSLLAPMQTAVRHAHAAHQEVVLRQQSLLTRVATLEQLRHDTRQLRDALGQRYPSMLSSAEYWQWLTELAAMQRLRLSGFSPEAEKTGAMITSSGARFTAHGDSQSAVSFVQTALSGGGLLGTDNLVLRRSAKGQLTIDFSLRHYRSLVAPPATSQLVNLPRSVPRLARDLFAQPDERARAKAAPAQDRGRALRQSLQGYHIIASISDHQQAWALVQSADGGTQRLAVGDALGEGVITRIDDRRITVTAGDAVSQIHIGK
jgi:Tfp pilus assembly protein PilO